MTAKDQRRGGALSSLLDSAIKSDPSKATGSRATLIEVAPEKTRMNDLHRRSELTTSGPALDELVSGIQANGQILPAKGWKLKRPEGEIEYVLAYGARRRAACLKLGRPLKIDLLPEPPSDKEVIRLMHGENRSRLDYQPLEDAREYQSMMQSGAFASQAEMADELAIDKSKLSRLMSLLKLPEEILSLYTDPQWLTLVHGTKLASVIEQGGPTAKRVLETARRLAKESPETNPTPELIAATKPPKPSPKKTANVYLGTHAIGKITGDVEGQGGLSIQLASTAPETLKKRLAEVIDSWNKEQRK